MGLGPTGLSDAPIPNGWYCYTRLTPMEIPQEGGLPRMLVKPCPYWNGAPEGSYDAYCEFLNVTDDVLLWDQVKICNVRDDPDEEDDNSLDDILIFTSQD